MARDAALMYSCKSRETRSWQAMVECLADRASRNHWLHPVGAKVAIGGGTLPQIGRIDCDADRVCAGWALSVVEQGFVIPRLSGKQPVAYVPTEFVDTVFVASMLESGRLTPAFVRLATLSAIGFLTHYLGRIFADARRANGAPSSGIDAALESRRFAPRRNGRRVCDQVPQNVSMMRSFACGGSAYSADACVAVYGCDRAASSLEKTE